MNTVKKSLLVASLIASLGISTVYAATQGDYDTNPNKMKDLVASYKAAKEADGDGDGRPDGMAWREIDPQNSQNHPRINHRIGSHKSLRPGEAFRELATLTGKDAKEIANECRTKKITPAAYAKEAGVLEQYKATRKATFTERLNKAVIDGKITRDKADRAINSFDKRFEDQVNNKMPQKMHGLNKNFGQKGHGPKGSFMGKMPFDTLAELTHKDRKALMDQARDNKKSCYDLAKEADVLDAFKAKRLEENKTMLKELVKNGKMDQKRADEIMKNVEKRINDNKPERSPRVHPMHPGPARMPQALAK